MTLLHFHIKSTDRVLIKAVVPGGWNRSGASQAQGKQRYTLSKRKQMKRGYMASAMRKMSHNQKSSMTYVQNKLLTQAWHICDSTLSV